MSRDALPELEIALLCSLYYLEPASTASLLAPPRAENDLHALMAERLGAVRAPAVEQELQRLVTEGLAGRDGLRWRLTDRGRALAYEAGELEIQRQSGLWRKVVALLPARSSFQRILDVGSAGGSAARAMREAGLLASDGIYIGVDISHRALTAGIELAHLGGGQDAATLRVQSTAYRLPLPGEAVDCCVSRSTLYYLRKRSALAEMARVARTGGYLIVAVPTIAYMTRRALRGWAALRVREAIKYTAAMLLGSVAWLGVDVRPPRALFSGETKRSVRAQVARIPAVRIIFLEKVSLPFIGTPLLLVAEKLAA